MSLPSSLSRSDLTLHADRLQRVDVEPGVGLVEDGVLRRDDRHLQHLEPLFLAAREAVVDVAAQERRVHVERVELLEHELAEFRRIEIVGAHRLARGAHEVRDRDARDRGRILERQEQPGLGALVGRQLEQLLAVQRHRTAEHLVARVPGHRERERRFAAPVGAHQGVNAPRLDGEIYPLEDLRAFDRDPQVAHHEPARVRQASDMPRYRRRAAEKVKESLDYLRLPW